MLHFAKWEILSLLLINQKKANIDAQILNNHSWKISNFDIFTKKPCMHN